MSVSTKHGDPSTGLSFGKSLNNIKMANNQNSGGVELILQKGKSCEMKRTFLNSLLLFLLLFDR